MVALTMGGKVLTWGTGQQGQLGRLPARRTGRRDERACVLAPALVTFVHHRRDLHTAQCAAAAAPPLSRTCLTRVSS